MCLCNGRLRVSGGFCLLAAWFAQANGWGLLWTVLWAAAVHEAGHWCVLRLLGARVSGLRLTVFGAEMEASWPRLTYGGEFAAVLAGPAANLLCGMVLAAGKVWQAAGAHLVLCAFNLLPVRPLDGGRALELAVSWAFGPAAGDRAARWAGGVTALSLAAGLLCLLRRTGGSLWLLPAVFGAGAAAVRELFTGSFSKKPRKK